MDIFNIVHKSIFVIVFVMSIIIITGMYKLYTTIKQEGLKPLVEQIWCGDKCPK